MKLSKIRSAAFSSPIAIRYFLFIALCSVVFKHLLLFPTGYELFYIKCTALIVLCVSLSHYPYRPEEKAIRPLLGGIALLFGVYDLINYPVFDQSGNLGNHLRIAFRCVALLFGFLALFRPFFALFPLAYTGWRKQLDIQDTGFLISPTDYYPVIEVGLWLAISMLILRMILFQKKNEKLPYHTLANYILIAGIGIHFGNYFHSGIAKLLMEGGPLSWTLENKTHYLMLAADELGTLPIANLKTLKQFLYELISNSYVGLNIVVLLGQLICLYMILTPQRIVAISFFYDAMHLVIFFLTGIFFWKWITMNMLIILAARNMHISAFDKYTKKIGVAFTIFGVVAFFTAQLAWYDTRSLRDVYVYAKDTNGQNYRLPTNYYLNLSVTAAQSRLLPSYPGHFYTANSLGSSVDYQVMNKLNECDPILSDNDGAFDYSQLEKTLRRLHAFYIDEEESSGTLNFNIFPHHIWSNFGVYSEIVDLPKNQIQSYHIVVESKCLSMENGRTSSKIIVRNESDPIYVHQ